MPRYVIAAALGGLVTFGLFYLMQWLIYMEAPRLGAGAGAHVIEFVRLKRETEVETKKREMPKREKPPEPPPPPDLTMKDTDRPEDALEGIGIEPDTTLEGGSGIGDLTTDTECVPLVRILPEMPDRAAERNIQGWVEVEFTISPAGGVLNPTIVQSTSNIFHRAALRAIRKWKYSPKVEDGKAVDCPRQRVTLQFKLEDA